MDQDWVLYSIGVVAGFSALRTAFYNPGANVASADLHPKWPEAMHALETIAVLLAFGVLIGDFLMGFSAVFVYVVGAAQSLTQQLQSEPCAYGNVCTPADTITGFLVGIVALAVVGVIIAGSIYAARARLFTGYAARWITWFVTLAATDLSVRALYNVDAIWVSAILVALALYSVYTILCEIAYRRRAAAPPV